MVIKLAFKQDLGNVIATDKVYKNTRGTPIPRPNPPACMAIMMFNFVDLNLTLSYTAPKPEGVEALT